VSRIVPVLLAGLLAGLAAIVAVEVLAPPAGTDDVASAIRPAPRLPRLGAAASQAAPDHTDEWVATILARPLFTRDRKPTTDHPAATVALSETLPRLAGIAISPYGRQAIFAGDDGKPVVVSEGGQVAGYTVRAITAGMVQIDGPDGKRALVPAFDLKSAPPAVAADAPVELPQPAVPGMPLQFPGPPGMPQFRPPPGVAIRPPGLRPPQFQMQQFQRGDAAPRRFPIVRLARSAHQPAAEDPHRA
jgi:hypothetical protein